MGDEGQWTVKPDVFEDFAGVAREADGAGISVRAGSRGALRMIRGAGIPDPGLVQSVLMTSAEERAEWSELARERNHVHVTDGPVHRYLLNQNADAYVFTPGNLGKVNILLDVLTQMYTNNPEVRPVVLIGRDFWGPVIQDFLTRRYRNPPA